MDRALMHEIEEHYESGGWTNEERLQYGKKIKTKEDVARQLGLDPAKKTAVVFSHILWDATFFYGSDVFENYAQWLVETVRAASRNTNLNWIVKLHPANVWKRVQDGASGEFNEFALLKQKLGDLPGHIKFIDPYTDINTFSLFPLTDYCLTVRGTIGIEMPCFGIPVIVAGTGRYAGYGFTNDSSTAAEYLQKLDRLETIPRLNPEQVEIAKKHAYALFVRRPLNLTSYQLRLHTDNKTGGLTERDVVITVKDASAFRAAPDLNAFADWVVNTRDHDYLA
jgi:hypothetical protein